MTPDSNSASSDSNRFLSNAALSAYGSTVVTWGLAEGWQVLLGAASAAASRDSHLQLPGSAA
ncbi:MAG: hypothetical protein DMG88_20560 [Acidobacteria bacterium]|nr:MAG: hypothetical protein DMG88_20560 [Acidobacteriota bacterium]